MTVMCAIVAGQFNQVASVIDGLVAAAVETGRLTRRYVKRKRRERNRILRSGRDTPLWDELALAVRRHLTKRGDKAQLGRILGLPRQRVHQLFVARSAMPDAERTLMLIRWLINKNQDSTAKRVSAPNRRKS